MMSTTLIDLLKKESQSSNKTILMMAALSGVANAGILAIINSAAAEANHEESNFKLLLLFLIALITFIYTQRFIFRETSAIIEGIIDRIRLRIADKIRESNLLTIEALGRSEIYSRLTQGTTTISQSGMAIIASVQSLMMVVFAVFYIATLSMPAFFLTIGMIVGGVYIYLIYDKKIVSNILRSTRKEVEFFTVVTHTLDGFKESKMNARRATDLADHTNATSKELRGLKVITSTLFTNNYIFAQSFFYVLLAAIVFVLPRLIETYSESITEISSAILFIIGPLSTVVAGIPAYTNANTAAMDISMLEDVLDKHESDVPVTPNQSVFADRFSELRLHGIEFSYRDPYGKPMFGVGPIDLTLKGGEITFVVGGNGSGKSTFLKLLTSLYRPDRGSVSIDGRAVNEDSIQAYREMFSVIFAEFHLFDRLYGMRDVNEQRVKELLNQFRITDKTQFVDGRFTNIDLSTGQRKRLAMVVALLEDRPIYVFDEWAAEQDPEFRRFFYEELLQELKQRGKTVVAVTHDDRYFENADKVVKMDYGRIVEYTG